MTGLSSWMRAGQRVECVNASEIMRHYPLLGAVVHCGGMYLKAGDAYTIQAAQIDEFGPAIMVRGIPNWFLACRFIPLVTDGKSASVGLRRHERSCDALLMDLGRQVALDASREMHT